MFWTVKFDVGIVIVRIWQDLRPLLKILQIALLWALGMVYANVFVFSGICFVLFLRVGMELLCCVRQFPHE